PDAVRAHRRHRTRICGGCAVEAGASAAAAVRSSGNELLAALGPAPCQDLAAVLRGHACAEPMRALAAYLARLVGALHRRGSVDPQVSVQAGQGRAFYPRIVLSLAARSPKGLAHQGPQASFGPSKRAARLSR